MAVHPNHPELNVEIIVDEEALQEYANDEGEQDARDVTRYVQASSGACFAVRYAIPAELFAQHGVRAVIEIDGVEVRKSPYGNSRLRRELGHTVTCDATAARVNGVDMGQKFRFAEIKPGESRVVSSQAFRELTFHTISRNSTRRA